MKTSRDFNEDPKSDNFQDDVGDNLEETLEFAWELTIYISS